MRLNSIRSRTLLVLVLICVAIVCILGGFWLYTTSQNIRSSVYDTDLHDSRIMAEYVSEYVGSIAAPVKIISADHNVSGAITANNSAYSSTELQHLIGATPQDDVAYLMGRDGRVLYSTCSTAMEYPLTGSYDRNVTVTGIFFSKDFKDYAFAIICPVRDNSTIVGYTCDIVRPSDLNTTMNGEISGFIHHIIVVDGSGRVIFHDNRSAIGTNADLSGYPPVARAMGGGSGIIEHMGVTDLRPHISAYSPVGDTGWIVIVSTYADTAYSPLVGQALRIACAGLLFIAALTIFGYFATAYLIKPIEKLSANMARVSEGDYSVSVRSDRDDEIGDLERSFGSLVSEIRDRDESIRSEKDRSEFYLDLMSHDISNMNQSGMGYLEMAIEDLRGQISADDLAYIENALESVGQSSALIARVRRIQSIQAGALKHEVIDLARMLEEVKTKYAHYPGRDVAVNFSRPTRCHTKAYDLFSEVIANIVGNAIKHSDPSKPLTIDMSLERVKDRGKDYCRIAIEDNGPGIPDGMKESIFTRLQRGSTGTGGKGLGLYIVKILVEEFGGRVWAEDRVAGDHTQGARFVILMPAAET